VKQRNWPKSQKVWSVCFRELTELKEHENLGLFGEEQVSLSLFSLPLNIKSIWLNLDKSLCFIESLVKKYKKKKNAKSYQ